MSLFRRPAWAQNPNANSTAAAATASAVEDEEDNDTPSARPEPETNNWFSHADRSFGSIFRESHERKLKTRREEEKQENGTREDKKVDLKKGKGIESSSSSSSVKRRRITREDGAALLSEVGISPTLKLGKAGEEQTQTKVLGSTLWSGKRLEDGNLAEPITLGDSDGEEEEVQIQSTRVVQTQDNRDNDEDEESDPDLARLQREARERKKIKETVSSTPSATKDFLDLDAGGDKGTARNGISSPATQDPPIQLLVTSNIPDTNPLIVYRKMSQRLQEVRLMWCRKQDFSEEFTSKVFLTFCGRRKYDVTTVKSLGLEIDDSGIVVLRHARDKGEVDRVHLEAVTEEILEQQKAEKERQARLKSGEYEAEEGDETAAVTAAESYMVEQDVHIRLIVKAKDKSDWHVKVKPDTIISKIVKAARKAFDIGSEQDTYLEFDGERLDPDSQVQQTEIEDLNCLDLYLGK